jgi:hypothetical protein
MNRYIIKKYVMAKSLAEALKKEREIKPEDAWKDEKQPEAPQADAIGFNLDASDYYYSPVLKRKRKK